VFREATKCSERHACGQMEILRAQVRYQARGRRHAKANERLRVRLRELAEERRRDAAQALLPLRQARSSDCHHQGTGTRQNHDRHWHGEGETLASVPDLLPSGKLKIKRPPYLLWSYGVMAIRWCSDRFGSAP